ncbi:hypothetical protein PCASD_07325 [Puccinia coronata f. sp. avenae]|uniref:Uncharacterized protein n=1 Tax=Puccinia coronata f. sp. avenae TaxID=200324 RepID=A0A2N5URJ7_9BASI|nr:hypothetical protein PCASD_07325 [Puccinia coronata f. sp. avenae]
MITNNCASSTSSSQAPSDVHSRSSSLSANKPSSGMDSLGTGQEDGTDCLENIFNSVLSGVTGPTLANETFRASQARATAGQSGHHSRSHHTNPHPGNPTMSTRHANPQPGNIPSAPNNPNLNREQADFEAAQFALKQAK